MTRIVLASSSPRRIGFLKLLGVPFRKAHPKVDERPLEGESPRAYVLRLARAKASAVSSRFPNDWVLGADTTVAMDGVVFGKPENPRDARRILRALSGRWHEVLTALAFVHRAQNHTLVAVSKTRVKFRDLSPSEIRWYVETSEASDKAGSYASQGKGGLFIERLSGSPSNVIGFPLETFALLAKRAGLSFDRALKLRR